MFKFYSEELHAVMSQFEMVYILFSVYNEPIKLHNLIGLENLMRTCGYDQLKLSVCGMQMDSEVDKLTEQLKKIEQCLKIAQTGVFYKNESKDFDKTDFKSSGINLIDSMNHEDYLILDDETNLTNGVRMDQLQTSRVVFLVNKISDISNKVKRALQLTQNRKMKIHVEVYAALLFEIHTWLYLENDPGFRRLFRHKKFIDEGSFYSYYLLLCSVLL